jgi:D-alanyl-D-alanine carboxypeptidase
MKRAVKSIFIVSFYLLTSLPVLMVSCKKGSTNDPNQPYLDRMKAAADSVLLTSNVPGIVALVVDKTKGIDWLYTVGYSELTTGRAMNGSFTFRIGSCTKTFTVTVLLQLVAERKLSLDDKLSLYFPQYPKSDSVTIRMMCNMTSRIHDYFHSVPALFDLMKQDPSRIWTPSELIDIGFNLGYDETPGKGFGYSNTNTAILGRIIEKITGNTLEEEITQRIIIPLNLVNSGFLTSGTQLPGTHGHGYYFIDYVPGADYTEHFDNSVYWAAGSAWSTPRELQKYVEALVGGGLLPDSLQYCRLHNDFTDIGDVSYGLGILKQGTFYGHTGELPGFMTNMYHSNDRNCTIIIYYNSLLSGKENDPGQLFKRFVSILYGVDKMED